MLFDAESSTPDSADRPRYELSADHLRHLLRLGLCPAKLERFLVAVTSFGETVCLHLGEDIQSNFLVDAQSMRETPSGEMLSFEKK